MLKARGARPPSAGGCASIRMFRRISPITSSRGFRLSSHLYSWSRGSLMIEKRLVRLRISASISATRSAVRCLQHLRRRSPHRIRLGSNADHRRRTVQRRGAKANPESHNRADNRHSPSHLHPVRTRSNLHLDSSPQHIPEYTPTRLNIIEKRPELRPKLLAPASRIQHSDELNPTPHTGFNLCLAVFTTLSSSVTCSCR